MLPALGSRWLAAVALFPLTALSQTATGRLAGTVLDPTRAAVPGAAVVVRSEATGAALELVSSPVGAFTAAALSPGFYTIEVSAEGFRPHTIEGQKVDVARETSLPPIVLELGAATEVIVVEGGVSQVQTTNAEVSSIITAEQIAELPLIGRDPLSFVKLQAGVVQAGAGATTINGQRTSFSNVTLDGINIQDNYIRGNGLDFLASRTLVDQVAEFSVTSQNGSPAVGGGSSQVNFTTRSGGPELHGNLYWHNRNDNLAAGEWFSNRQGLEKPFLNFNQVGGSLGGPLIPNRAFFFVNYETLRARQQSLANSTILTSDAARGVFSYLDQAGTLRKVNVLRMQGLQPDPEVARVLERIPDPGRINNFDVGDSTSERLLNTAGYRFFTRSDRDRDAVTSRIDWNLTDRDVLGVTYKFSREDTDRPDAGVGFQARPVVKDFGHTNFLSAGWRTSPGPRWTNDLHIGFNLAPGDFRTTEDLGDFLVGGFAFTNPTVNFQPQGRYTNTYNYRDNALTQRGRHTLQFGFDAQQIRVDTFNSGGLLPTMALGLDVDSQFRLSSGFFPGGIDSNDLGAAEDLLATLAGVIGQASRVSNVRDRSSGFVDGQEFRRRYRFDTFSTYLQDNFKIAPRLTLNLGLRWEYLGRLDEKDGLMLLPVTGPDGVVPTLLSDAELDFAGGAAGRPLWRADRNNFAPNIGLAWDVFGDGTTAVRAGYSVNYVNDEIIQAAENAVIANDGLQGSALLQNVDAFLRDGAVSVPAPEFAVPRRVSQNQAFDPTAAVFTIDPNLRAPYVQQWNFSLQRDIGWDTIVEARYLGNKGTKLIRAFDFNQVILNENGFLEDFRRARQNGFLALEATGEFNPEFDGTIAGSQALAFFPRLVDGGLLGASTIQELIRRGEVGTLAEVYILNNFTDGTDVSFRRNQNALVGDLVTNYSNSSYHALQLEARRRAAEGLQLQANYSFSKVLTDSSGTAVRFDPFLDFAQPQLERARAEFDLTHVFNANFVWQLPFTGSSRWVEGWTISSIFTWQSGAPLSILSGRGTINRRSRSSQNTADSDLTKPQLDDIVGFRMSGDGPFFIDSAAISPRDNSGVSPDGEPPFSGQAFSHPDAGAVGALGRRIFSGPSAFAFDFSVSKTTHIRENHTLKLGARVENILNHPTFLAGDQYLDSEQFGRISSTLTSPRRIELLLRYEF